MKKIMSLLMMVAMVSNTAFAANNTVDHTQLIANAFNQFRYSMTADADAADASFQAKAVANFKQRMADLQAQGVSADEIMGYTRANILDASTRADFDRMMASMNTNQVSSEQAGNLAMQFMAAKYQQGASYSGGGKGNVKIALIIIGVVIVGVVTYLVVKHIQDCKPKTVTETNTETKTNTETTTQTNTETQTNTVTNTEVQTNTVTNTETDTATVTNVETETQVNTVTNTEVLTNTVTATQVYTNTVTDVETNTVTFTDTTTVTYTNTNTNTNTHGQCQHGYSYGSCPHNGCPNHVGNNNGYGH